MTKAQIHLTANAAVDVLGRSDYSDYMITNLRDAKSNLSQLVQLAAQGEDVVITVRGQPMAKLTCAVPKRTQNYEREAWAAELSAAAEAARVGPRQATSPQFWDDLREERL
jgi:prevent-host-death family protein